MQLKIWGEMINGGSYDNPPTTSMFSKAGSTPKRSGPSVNQVTVDAANAIMSSFSGRASPVFKLIEDRSKSYKQLLELHSLKSANVLSETEYQAELLKKPKDVCIC